MDLFVQFQQKKVERKVRPPRLDSQIIAREENKWKRTKSSVTKSGAPKKLPTNMQGTAALFPQHLSRTNVSYMRIGNVYAGTGHRGTPTIPLFLFLFQSLH